MSFLIVSLVAAQIVIFFTFILFFKRIMTSNVVSATKHLDDLSQEYDKRDKDVAARLEAAKKEAQEIVAKAVGEAQANKDEVMRETEKEREAIIKKARTQSAAIMEQADKSRELLISEIDQRIAREAVNKASELIQYALPEELKRSAHAEWVKDLVERGFDSVGGVKVVEGIEEVKVASAFPLAEGDRAKLSKKVNALLGKEVELKIEIDPKVVAGIVVEIGSVVLDGSLRSKILERSSALEKKQR